MTSARWTWINTQGFPSDKRKMGKYLERISSSTKRWSTFPRQRVLGFDGCWRPANQVDNGALDKSARTARNDDGATMRPSDSRRTGRHHGNGFDVLL